MFNFNPFEGMFKPSSYTKPWLYPILMPYTCLVFVAMFIYAWVIRPMENKYYRWREKKKR